MLAEYDERRVLLISALHSLKRFVTRAMASVAE
jgi:hypothetical protein